MLTLAPLCSSASAKALPIPCAAPVTSATLPFTCMVWSQLQLAVGELRVSARPQLLWPPARSRAAWPRAPLPVGGDETVKPALGNPHCVTCLRALPGAKLRVLFPLDLQTPQIPGQRLLSASAQVAVSCQRKSRKVISKREYLSVS